MTHDDLFEELRALAAQLSIPIRFEQGDFEGGLCMVNDVRVIIVNKRAGLPRKVSTLALAVSQLDLDSVFVKPAVREAIEDELAKIRAEAAQAAAAAAPIAPEQAG